MRLTARLEALEQRMTSLDPGAAVAVILGDGEEWEQVRERLKGSGGVIVVRRTLTAEEWNDQAPEQQRKLTASH